MRLPSPSALRRTRATLLALAALLVCAHAHSQLTAKHVRSEVLTGRAQLIGPLDPAQRLHLSLVLPLRNRPELDSLLQRLYDPTSPDFHRFLAVAEFTRRFSPTPSDYNATLAFARASGFTVDAEPANRLIVPVSATVAQIESAFHLRINLYHHPSENRAFFSPDREPVIDASLPIAHVVGLNNYAPPRPLLRRPSPSQTSATGSGPSGSFLASDMRAAYYGGSALTGTGQSIALVEFDGYNRSDVDLTFSSAGQTYSVPIENILLDGLDGSPLRSDDAEAVLDIVQAIGMAPGLSAVRVYIGASDAPILNAIAADNLAQQVSISWTWAPDDPETDDVFFLEMAAQGQSVFAASGDTGAFDPANLDFYPAEDAYVTAVGGTRLVTSGPAGAWQAETAWTYSGGGASPDSIPIPPWQIGVSTTANNASTTLRNVPDVAAEAGFDNYVCVTGTCSDGWAGTSFAAPRWAAFTALANQQAALNGDPPIGFLNPTLYALASSAALHDIVSGSNNTGGNCCNAVVGYDLVTGWGSPAGQALIDALAPPTAPPLHLTANPAAVTLKTGASASVTITTHAPSPATLSITGLPHGVTATWSANPSSSTTLTLIASSSALRGSSLLTITATAGSATATTHLALNIDAPGFTIAASPAMQLYPGASTSTTIAITPYAGFNSNVHFAVTSALPAGVNATWLDNPSAASAQLTLTASSSATAAHAMVTVTGISSALSSSTHIALTLSAPQFVLNLSPYPLQLAEGESQSSTVSVIPIGSFNSSVSITAPLLPSGVTASLQPSTATVSTLTLSASSTAPVGPWPAVIQGTSGQSSSQSTSQAQFTQTITAPRTARFTVATSPAYARVARSSSVPINVAIAALNGFASSVTLAASNLPDGITASWSKNPTSSGSVLTLKASPLAITGAAQPVVIEGTSGTLATRALLYLTVDPAPSFTLSPSPASIALATGGTASATVSATAQPGFTGTIAFSIVSALPAGITATLKPAPSSAALSLSAGASATPASFPLIIEATAAGQTVTASIPVTVAPPAPVVSAITPAFTSAGTSSATLTINGVAFNSNSTVYWNDSARPTRFLSPNQLTADISSTDLAQPGIATITIHNDTAVSNDTMVSNAFQFEIDSACPTAATAPIFTPSSIAIAAGQSAAYPVTLPANISSASALCLNLPAHAACSYSGTKLTISTAPDTPHGAWPITVVFTETQTTTATASLLIPILLLPWILIRRRLTPRTTRLADLLCLAVIAAAVIAVTFITACGSTTSKAPPTPTGSTHTFTSSAVITLTIH
jgi:hypothetical protein